MIQQQFNNNQKQQRKWQRQYQQHDSIQIDNINNNDGGQMILRYGKFGLVCTWNLPQSKTYLTRRLSTASRSQICWFTVAWRHLIQTLWDQGINVDTELALLGSGHTQVITSLHIQCNVYFAVSFISLQSRLCQCRHRRYVGGQKDENSRCDKKNMKPSSPDMGIFKLRVKTRTCRFWASVEFLLVDYAVTHHTRAAEKLSLQYFNITKTCRLKIFFATLPSRISFSGITHIVIGGC